MFSLDQGSQISAYVEKTLLSWVRLHPCFESVTDLTSLNDGQFFQTLLSSLPNFKLLKPLTQASEPANLAAKVGIMKNISKSLISYHQTQLLRDVSDLDINYVELCMGNKKQLFRLISLIFSALWSQSSCRQELQKQTSKLTQQQQEIMKIMIENSLNLGHECGSCSTRSWRLSEQKKVFAKMQILQNKIEELELINKSMEQVLKSQKQSEETVIQQNKRLNDEVKKLLNLNGELVQIHQKTLNELKISKIQQDTMKKKYELVKTRLEEKISKLEEEAGKLQISCQQGKLLGQKLNRIQEINKEIKEQNSRLRQNLLKLQKQRGQLKITQKMHVEQFAKLKEHCGELQIKIEQLLLACSSRSDSAQCNLKTCYFGKKMEQQDGEELNRYRVKQNLGWLNSQNDWEEEKPKKYAHSDSRAIAEASLQDSIYLQYLKQNQSIHINSSELKSYSVSKKGPPVPYHKSISGGEEEVEGSKESIEQIKLLTCIILDLQAQLEEANKRNPVVCLDSSWASLSRMEKFKTKVKQMFDVKLVGNSRI